MVHYVAAIILVALIFDFSNGFHDSANSIATIVGTRVLSPLAAVLWAALFNFAAAFTSGTLIAKAVEKGIIRPDIVTPNLVLGCLLGAIIWNIVTWLYGIPSSSSHALIGGLAGAGVAKAGWGAITWGATWYQTLVFIVVSPLVGMLAGFLLMVAVYWGFRRMAPNRVDRFFRVMQLASSAALSHAHGANDAQKTMGIIVGLLVAVKPIMAAQTGFWHHLYVPTGDIPLWVKLFAYSAISLGTLFGGWRIVHTMGSRITRLRPISGFAAETGGTLALTIATHYGIPVSTTHTIAGAIMGAGATYRFSAVRWGIAERILWAWIITIPAAATVGGVCYWIISSIAGP
ncbi:MAG TPA: inorganic phosphate transporter [Chloroflexota bacterium]